MSACLSFRFVSLWTPRYMWPVSSFSLLCERSRRLLCVQLAAAFGGQRVCFLAVDKAVSNLTYVFLQRHASLGQEMYVTIATSETVGPRPPTANTYNTNRFPVPVPTPRWTCWGVVALAAAGTGLRRPCSCFHLAACMALGPKSQERGTYHGKILQRVVGCLDLGPRIFFGRLLASI